MVYYQVQINHSQRSFTIHHLLIVLVQFKLIVAHSHCFYMQLYTIFYINSYPYWVMQQILHPFWVKYSHSFHSLEDEKGPMSFTFGHTHPGIVGTKSLLGWYGLVSDDLCQRPSLSTWVDPHWSGQWVIRQKDPTYSLRREVIGLTTWWFVSGYQTLVVGMLIQLLVSYTGGGGSVKKG